MTPAAISHQIHALEADLGVGLFHRLNRQVELTPSGRLLLPGLSEAFAGIHAAVRRVRAHNETGALTITASPSFVAKWLVLRLHRFQEKFPAVDVRISTSDEIVDLTRGDFDMAIRYGTGRYPGSRCRIAAEERGVPGVQPAPVGNRAAAAHARRSAPSRADPRHRRRPRPAGADLADVAEGGWGQGPADELPG